MPRGHPVADEFQEVVRERLRVRKLKPYQIVDRLPVRFLVRVMLVVLLGFAFSWPHDDIGEGHHVHGAPGGAGRILQFGYLGFRAVEINRRRKQKVRIFEREVPALFRARGVDDRGGGHIPALDRSQRFSA